MSLENEAQKEGSRMSSVKRKIVAIGGGECGRMTENGQREPYETAAFDVEIIMLADKEKPHFLLLAHAQITNGAEAERGYFETMRRIYGDLYGCECRHLESAALFGDPAKIGGYLSWADIIYVGGGDTVAMMGLWRRTGFDRKLREAWEDGKVMCGVSAGATCWFALGNTDAPGFKEKEVNKLVGLGFIDAYFSPHCQCDWKRDSEISSLKHINKVGLSVSNCSAVEIVGDGYRIIKSAPADGGSEPYVLRTYFKNGKLFEEELHETEDLKSLDDLLTMK